MLSFASTQADTKENLQGLGCLPAKPRWSKNATERLHLPLWLRSKGLVDLPEVAFGIGKVRRAQPPGLVGWGSENRDALGLERLVCGVDILNTSGQKHARPSLDLQLKRLLTDH